MLIRQSCTCWSVSALSRSTEVAKLQCLHTKWPKQTEGNCIVITGRSWTSRAWWYDIRNKSVTPTVPGLLLGMCSKNEKSLWSTYRYRTSLKTHTAVIYVKLKIHYGTRANSKFADRPIISGNGSPWEKFSEFVDSVLLSFVTKQETMDVDFVLKEGPGRGGGGSYLILFS